MVGVFVTPYSTADKTLIDKTLIAKFHLNCDKLPIVREKVRVDSCRLIVTVFEYIRFCDG